MFSILQLENRSPMNAAAELCRRIALAMFGVLLILTLSEEVLAAQTLDLGAVERAVFALYPELRRDGLQITTVVQPQPLNERLTSRRVVATIAEEKRSYVRGTDKPLQVVELKIEFDAVGTVRTVAATPSAYLHSDSLRNLRQLIVEHPQWSNRRIDSELENAGARFGPTHGAEVQARIATVVSVMGKPGELRFRVLHSPKRPLDVHAWDSLLWKIVAVTGNTASAETTRFVVWVEPFEGRVVRLERSPTR
jgi:hypothetical protein